MPPIAATATGIRLELHIQPRASKTEVAGLHGDRVRIRLAAPPVDGAANAALVAFLADRLGVPRSAVRITAGLGSRRKAVEVDTIGVPAASRALAIGGD